MKKLLIPFLAVLFLIAALPSAIAQGYTAYAAQTLIAGGTNNVAAATTNTYTQVLTLTRQREVAVQISFKSTGTNSSTIGFDFLPSVDGTTFDTANAAHSLNFAANGTTTVVVVTNLVAPAGIGYLKLASVRNPNATQAITNLSVIYAVKR